MIWLQTSGSPWAAAAAAAAASSSRESHDVIGQVYSDASPDAFPGSALTAAATRQLLLRGYAACWLGLITAANDEPSGQLGGAISGGAAEAMVLNPLGMLPSSYISRLITPCAMHKPLRFVYEAVF